MQDIMCNVDIICNVENNIIQYNKTEREQL